MGFVKEVVYFFYNKTMYISVLRLSPFYVGFIRREQISFFLTRLHPPRYIWNIVHASSYVLLGYSYECIGSNDVLRVMGV